MGPFRTSRLTLRRWREEDRAPFARLNADAEVTEFLAGTLDPARSNALVDAIERHFEEQGFGLWAIEVNGGPPFIGFTGLQRPAFSAAFTPCVEIAWRFVREAWGRGYATEAAREACRIAFSELQLPELVSFTVPANARSWRVMERLGMRRSPAEDFDHPRLPEGHPLRRHVLYRLSREEWLRSGAGQA